MRFEFPSLPKSKLKPPKMSKISELPRAKLEPAKLDLRLPSLEPKPESEHKMPRPTQLSSAYPNSESMPEPKGESKLESKSKNKSKSKLSKFKLHFKDVFRGRSKRGVCGFSFPGDRGRVKNNGIYDNNFFNSNVEGAVRSRSCRRARNWSRNRSRSTSSSSRRRRQEVREDYTKNRKQCLKKDLELAIIPEIEHEDVNREEGSCIETEQEVPLEEICKVCVGHPADNNLGPVTNAVPLVQRPIRRVSFGTVETFEEDVVVRLDTIAVEDSDDYDTGEGAMLTRVSNSARMNHGSNLMGMLQAVRLGRRMETRFERGDPDRGAGETMQQESQCELDKNDLPANENDTPGPTHVLTSYACHMEPRVLITDLEEYTITLASTETLYMEDMVRELDKLLEDEVENGENDEDSESGCEVYSERRSSSYEEISVVELQRLLVDLEGNRQGEENLSAIPCVQAPESRRLLSPQPLHSNSERESRGWSENLILHAGRTPYASPPSSHSGSSTPERNAHIGENDNDISSFRGHAYLFFRNCHIRCPRLEMTFWSVPLHIGLLTVLVTLFATSAYAQEMRTPQKRYTGAIYHIGSEGWEPVKFIPREQRLGSLWVKRDGVMKEVALGQGPTGTDILDLNEWDGAHFPSSSSSPDEELPISEEAQTSDGPTPSEEPSEPSESDPVADFLLSDSFLASSPFGTRDPQTGEFAHAPLGDTLGGGAAAEAMVSKFWELVNQGGTDRVWEYMREESERRAEEQRMEAERKVGLRREL